MNRYIKATAPSSSTPLTGFSCDELTTGLTTTQQVCMRNASFLSTNDELSDIADIRLPSISYPGNYNTGYAKVAFNASADTYFVIARGASVQVRTFESDWVSGTAGDPHTLGGTNWSFLDIVSIGDYIYLTTLFDKTQGLANVLRVKADDLSETRFNRDGRAFSMLPIGTDIWLPRGQTANSEPKLVKFDTTTSAFTTSNSASSAAVNQYIDWDGNDVICHCGNGTSVASFYSISGDTELSSITFNIASGYVNVDANAQFRSSHFINGYWYITFDQQISKVDPSDYSVVNTYNITNSSTQGYVRPIVYDDRYLVCGTWQVGHNYVFDTQTERFITMNFNAVPFIQKNGNLGWFGTDKLTYTGQTQGVFIAENFQL